MYVCVGVGVDVCARARGYGCGSVNIGGRGGGGGRERERNRVAEQKPTIKNILYHPDPLVSLDKPYLARGKSIVVCAYTAVCGD